MFPRMSCKFLLSSLFFLTTQTFAQTSVIMPPLPDAASLVRNVDRPVSTYTGTPQINIPLWTVQLKKYTLPITLDYKASGVKIEEEASNVGLSWSLTAGGVVTRAVNDIPDDYNRYFSIHSVDDRPGDQSPSSEHTRVGRFWTGAYEALRNFNASENNQIAVRTALRNIKQLPGANSEFLEAQNDIEPDIFYFSFGGKSGKFVFDVNGATQQVALIPYQDIKVTHTLAANGEIAAFTIVDSDGTRYVFDQIERLERITASKTNPTTPDLPDANGNFPLVDVQEYTTITKFNSSWYLSSVTTINEESIAFTYTDESVDQFDRPGTTNVIVTRNNVEQNIQLNSTCGRSKSTSKKRLAQIETDKETLVFTASHQRLDVVLPAYAITNLAIIDKNTSRVIKVYDLNYSYFHSPGPNIEPLRGMNNVFIPLNGAIYPSYYERLKLESITEHNGTVTLPPYRFTYTETYPLPNRLSYQQDLWGYFNGAVNNASLSPALYVYPGFQGSDRYRVYPDCYYDASPLAFNMPSYTRPGANRLPIASRAKIGTLEKIVYPTGGYTEFDYELNRFNYDNCEYEGGGIRIKSIKSYSAVGQTLPASTKHYSYLNEVNGQSSGRIIDMPTFATPTAATIAVPSSTPPLLLHTNSQVAIGTTSGGYVGYQIVRESIGDQQAGGSLRYEYSVPATYNEATDPLYNLYQISQIKWNDASVSYAQADPAYMIWKNSYHLVPNTQPFPPNSDYDWNRGKLLKVTTFNSTGERVKEEVNTYQIYTPPVGTAPLTIYGLRYTIFPGGALYSKYALVTSRANVLQSTQINIYGTESYRISTPIHTQTLRYAYSPNKHLNPMEISSEQSDGRSIITRVLYPLDYRDGNMPIDPAILKLQTRNATSVPIETMTYIKENAIRQLIAAKITTFKLDATGMRVSPYKVFKLETTTPLLNFQESSIELGAIKYDPRYQEELSFDLYDAKNNPTQITEKRNSVQGYIWDYSKTCLVAHAPNARANDIAYSGFEAEGVTISTGVWSSGGWACKGSIQGTPGKKYLTLPPLQQQSTQNITKNGLDPTVIYQVIMKYKDDYGSSLPAGYTLLTGADGDGWLTCQKIFTGISSFDIGLDDCHIDELRLHPKGVQMTTYTHNPIIGITSKTDPNLRVTYYEYDEIGRLQRVRDEEGNIVTENEYRYAQP